MILLIRFNLYFYNLVILFYFIYLNYFGLDKKSISKQSMNCDVKM